MLNDNCVEVAVGTDTVRVRDSKDTGIRPLAVTPAAWTAFVAGTAPVSSE